MEAPPPCSHRRTRLVARDDEEEFRECLDCGEILERAESNDSAPFDESLSDA